MKPGTTDGNTRVMICLHCQAFVRDGDEAPKPKRHKYSAVKTEVEGIPFDSKHEAEVWRQLQLRQLAGEITDLRRQVGFPLFLKGKSEWVKCGVYVADFVYLELGTGYIVSDAKGYRTKEYLRKRKLMRENYGIEIREV